MGSSATISIGKYEFLSCQSYLSPLLLIFNIWDRRIETLVEDDEEYVSYKYITSVKFAKQCLDVSGHHITNARNIFESSKLNLEHFFENEYYDKIDEAIKEYRFENWYSSIKYFAKKMASKGYSSYDDICSMIKEIDKNNVSDYVVVKSLQYDSFLYWGLSEENADEWTVFRVILEAFDDDDPIILDYTALVDGGYCDTIQEENDFIFEKIIVLTEGSTDSEFISRSLKVLYPHLSKFFYFIDFGIMRLSGGVSFLSHYIKVFAGAKINNNIIGLFDNDSAALDELINLQGICFPNNIRIIKLPEIEIANNYPTLGPTQNQNINVNGLACSIELFFGKDILQQKDGTLTPIRWTGYKDRIRKYQGEIINKDRLQKKFRQKLNLVENGQQINLSDWKDMMILLENLIHAFD
jgi:hypothetical protein